MKTCSPLLFVCLLVAGVALLAAPVAAQQDPLTATDGRWHFSLAPYFWVSGLEGAVSFKGVPEVPVEASFSDILDNFDIGFLGHFEARKDRLGLGFDLIYLNLGAAVAKDRPILGRFDLTADLRQITAEVFFFHRLARGARGENAGFADVLVGVRYSGTSSKLTGEGLRDQDIESTKRTLDWVDGMIGLRTYAPLGLRAGLSLRADVAGFGSDFTWNLGGELVLKLSERWRLGAGYRYMDIDYDTGTGTDRKLFDVTYKGPQFHIAYTW